MRFFLAMLAWVATVAADACPAADPQCTTTAKSMPRFNWCVHNSTPRQLLTQPAYSGTKGFLRRPSPIGAPCSASTLEDCRETCLSNPRCITFSYASSSMTCTTYNKDLPHQTYKDRTTDRGMVFYNRGCFQRICCNAGQQRCSGTCTDQQTDPNNCGACGNVVCLSLFRPGWLCPHKHRLMTLRSVHQVHAAQVNATSSAALK